MFYFGFIGGLGVELINVFECEYGEVVFKFLVFGLVIMLLCKYVGFNLLKFCCVIGVLVFFFVVVYFGVWVLLDV